MNSISPESGVEIPKKTDDIFEAQGCPSCNSTGYRGRTTVSEILEVTREMEDLITKKPTTSEVEDLAIKQGMITMTQDGILKVLEGITTMEEVERVTEE